jgi:hypothetical protein
MTMPTTTETQWFYLSRGKRKGPFTDGELLAEADANNLTPNDPVWTTTDPNACPARDVEGLFAPPTPALQTAPKPIRTVTSAGPTLTCPYCWHRFPSDTALFIAGHPDLIGDHVLGQFESQRFLPSRFTPDGLAIDAGGVTCPDMACPRCHIRIPHALFNCTPLFVSIVGAPASGKSYYIASTTWKLRATLPKNFHIAFTDVDAQTNQWLHAYEEKLFLQTDIEALQAIVKTELQASHVYRTVTLNGMPIVLPLPCMFNLKKGHTNDAKDNRCLVLYDNAGEHFQAGQDTATAPGTQHLAHSEGILFFFDLSADPRMAPYLKDSSLLSMDKSRAHRQDVLLIETITRIQRRLGLNSTTRYKKPFVVVLSKADLLAHIDLTEDPWVTMPNGQQALDMDQIAAFSYWCRAMLLHTAPEIVTTVESFADHVVYIPVSALGHAPAKEGVQPKRIHPQWVETPPLYVLSHLGLVGRTTATIPDLPRAQNVERRGANIHLTVPGTSTRLEVPVWYCGHALSCPKTGTQFRVPDLDAIQNA